MNWVISTNFVQVERVFLSCGRHVIMLPSTTAISEFLIFRKCIIIHHFMDVFKNAVLSNAPHKLFCQPY
jgi:hypothetical protein